MGGFAAHFACGFFEFWRGGTPLLIIFSVEFATLSLTTARDEIGPLIIAYFGNNIKYFSKILAKIDPKKFKNT